MTIPVVHVVVEVETIGFIEIGVGIWLDITFPTRTPVSSPEAFDEPTPLSPPWETCIGWGALVGSLSTKFYIRSNSALILELTFETIREKDSWDIDDWVERSIFYNISFMLDKNSSTLTKTLSYVSVLSRRSVE